MITAQEQQFLSSQEVVLFPTTTAVYGSVTHTDMQLEMLPPTQMFSGQLFMNG